MRNYVFRGTMLALSPISHIAENQGTTSQFVRMPIQTPERRTIDVPYVSGNSFRGRLRDLGARHMCRTLGYGDPGSPDGLSLPAFHFLFSGGSLSRESGKALDIGYARRLRETIPLVSLLGGAVGNQILPGKLAIDCLIPVARETLHLLPDDLAADGPHPSIYDLIGYVSLTRRDDAKDERYRPMLKPMERLMIEDAEAHKAARREAGDDDVAGKPGDAQQMRYEVETLIAGTRLACELRLREATEIEFEALLLMLLEFSRDPYIGGKSSVGFGKVSISFDQWRTLDPRKPVEGDPLVVQDEPFGMRYRDHLETRAADIRAILGEMK